MTLQKSDEMKVSNVVKTRKRDKHVVKHIVRSGVQTTVAVTDTGAHLLKNKRKKRANVYRYLQGTGDGCIYGKSVFALSTMTRHFLHSHEIMMLCLSYRRYMKIQSE